MDQQLNIDPATNRYGEMASYDRFCTPQLIEERIRTSRTLPGSSSSLLTYTVELLDLFGLAESRALSTDPMERIVERPTDEELWLSLVGIFESGDPHFAEKHDRIYLQGA